MFDPSLRHALDTLLVDVDQAQIVDAARFLSAHYRSGCFTDHGRPVLDRLHNAYAYAAVRMPATYAALRAALNAVRDHVEFAPRTHFDVGGGTGAAVWAAAAVWPGIASRVLEQSPAAVAVGRELLACSSLSPAEWIRGDVNLPWPAADLVSMSYVLGELPDPARVVERAAAVAGTVVVVEPGTPGGFERILAARDAFIRHGLRIAAPCPHMSTCPMQGSSGWCHFAARVDRAALHRIAKAGTRNYEDEKYAYVVATRSPVNPAASRVVGRPAYGRNRVDLRLCRSDRRIARAVIPKSAADYKEARRLGWGSPWSGSNSAADELDVTGLREGPGRSQADIDQ
ncbi:MAG TPA: small ribosomal subunit Rsm22 family protein [Mycobacteriales bacterium]|nr:small ribosomal subunit Rsm22 family protein [Mycobacteriales bacterium]